MENNNLSNIRHSLAHLLAAAVMELYPETKRTIGPAIDDGFYFDFEFKEPISDADLPKIEKQMRKILPKWDKFERHELTAEEAKHEYPGNEYKHELIDEFTKDGSKVTFYKSGSYWDLCRGGHADSMKDIDPGSFKLTKVTGAYWRGDEKNKMLTRIYGLAFASKEELEQHLNMLEEAKKRDHKKVGLALDLFTFSDLVGAGLPLFTPRGTIIRNLLDDFVWELRKQRGYVRVDIPHITRKELYETSGHWDKYKDDLFKISTREGHGFVMKPMNCPHHTQIYARKPYSYRDLPERFADTTKVYRDEQSGELRGLERVLSITQDDAHVFCRMAQAKDEALKVWDIIHEFYGTFGFALKVRLSLRDPAHPEKYLGSQDKWDIAEKILREIVEEKETPYFEGPGEAAFYGPKLDFMATDAIGRQSQVATVQIDMNMPERFDLTCTNENGEKERIVMVHAAIMGSIERFISNYLEHCAGNLPLWLSPTQIAVLPISDKHIEYAKKVSEELKSKLPDLRFTIDDRSESIGKKIREATVQKIPYALIVGDKEIENSVVSVRSRNGEDLGPLLVSDLVEKLSHEIIAKK